ncbi:enolase C-terminal domain-like protein [Streptomyces sp. JJ38]|uniref:enolase C-terminal domain-like protein n=1 Tax=Streptomyces sp. JJ38 TaxID=2738128 RepID=UPI0027DFFB19|nr:enolase C-terminal domain-like protein [Streptomyces sp. JJ38]MBW1599766.1 mandelate racemase [Streptomyces sp. JJ38]
MTLTPSGGVPVRAPVEQVRTYAWTIPTTRPESDATLSWDATTVVVVEVKALGAIGTGWTYGHEAVATLVDDVLAGIVRRSDALSPGRTWTAMLHACRNIGVPGVAAMAASAVDTALWDLKARLLGVPLVTALDAVHEVVPVYGSGGFTSWSDAENAAQLTEWLRQGIPRVKIKVGRDPAADPARLRSARSVVGPETELYVDAGGGYSRKDALSWAGYFADQGVRWLQEPVSSDDLEGLRLLRDRAPGGLEIAAGEYGFGLPHFRRMLEAGAVDCLVADVTRCGGFTGFRRVAALCDARGVSLSAHGAPQLSAHACAAVWHLRHLEYFHDHVRIEELLFDGVLRPESGGVLRPDRARRGHGLTLVPGRVARYRVR